MKINLTLEVTGTQAREILAVLLNGEASLPKVVVTTTEPKKEETKEEPKKEEPKKEEPKKVETKYTIESIRKAAKDAAREKGQPFVKQALDSVGATSISKIEPDKFDEFMHLLNDKK